MPIKPNPIVQHGDSTEEEAILQQVLNVLSLKPLDYQLKNIWNKAFTNEELQQKFKATLKEYTANGDVS